MNDPRLTDELFNDLFGNLKKSPFKDIHESIWGKEKPEEKAKESPKEPQWPSVRIKR